MAGNVGFIVKLELIIERNKMDAETLINSSDFDFSNCFKECLIGNGGAGLVFSRIYLDLHDMSFFENCEANCNTWIQRDDDSLVEIAHDSGYGYELTKEELDWLEEDGVSNFGYQEWLNDQIIPKVNEALDWWNT